MASPLKKRKQCTYHICVQDYPDGDSNCILTIQNTKTLKTQTMTLLQLANNMDLLSKFSPEDIFMIAYVAGQQQLVCSRKIVTKFD